VAPYHAKKRLGQHFLKSQPVITRIVELIYPHSNVPVIEIGPGRGALTLPLAEKGVNIVAVEFDRDVIGYLSKLVRRFRNVDVINQDFLSFVPDRELLPAFSLVGNLPYNITAPVIDWCLKYHDSLVGAVFLVQKELADRITAVPKSKDWSPLAVITQLHFAVRHCFDVPPESFRPPPKVTSSVIELGPKERPSGLDTERFEGIVRASFSHRRKQLINNLVPGIIASADVAREVWAELSLSSTCRAEELSIGQFLKLTDELTARRII
jgi:16S rRNA (adenine1518-N6/adenine1519-N6)-dimethyltransferase